MAQCVICGREFEPYVCRPSQKTCSEECRKVYVRRYQRECYKNMTDDIRTRHKLHIREKRNGSVICILCGKPVFRCVNTAEKFPRMHEECIYRDCAKTLMNGEPLSKAQHSRLYARGWTVTEFKAAMMEGG